MAQLAVAAAGAAIGGAFGSPSAGWLIGSFIGSQLFGETQKVEGPRLAMLWPEMDAAFLAAGGSGGGPPTAVRRPVLTIAAG